MDTQTELQPTTELILYSSNAERHGFFKVVKATKAFVWLTGIQGKVIESVANVHYHVKLVVPDQTTVDDHWFRKTNCIGKFKKQFDENGTMYVKVDYSHYLDQVYNGEMVRWTDDLGR